jgi:hypothetical protein
MSKKKPMPTALVPAAPAAVAVPADLLADVSLIDQARDVTARSVNSALVMLYWGIGRNIVSALSAQWGWSHFIELLPMTEALKRDFYAEMCRVERWSVRTLRQKIGGMLFERTALSRKPEKLAEEELAKLRTSDQLSPDLVFRDPYLQSEFLDEPVFIANPHITSLNPITS